MAKKIKLVFFGTSEFAKTAVELLMSRAQERFELLGLVCQPDRPKGRGRSVSECPVKVWGRSNQKLVYQPERLKELMPVLMNTKPDTALVVAYGKILPSWMFESEKFFPFGLYNIHASLLPKFRGPSPIRAAIMAGEDKTGICVQKMVPTLDAGPVWMCQEIPIEVSDVFGDVYQRLLDMLPKVIKRFGDEFPPGEGVLRSQDQLGIVSGSEKLRASDRYEEVGGVRWSKIRALLPDPGVWITVSGKRLFKICRVAYLETAPERLQARLEIRQSMGQLTCLSCDGHRLKLEEIQSEGRARQSSREWLNGHHQLVRQLVAQGVFYEFD